MRNIAQAFVVGAVKIGFSGPAILAVSLLRAAEVRLGLGERYTQSIAPSADRSNLLLPDTWIGSLDGLTEPAADALIQTLLDILWQCFDEPRCREYDAKGNWAPGR